MGESESISSFCPLPQCHNNTRLHILPHVLPTKTQTLPTTTKCSLAGIGQG